jgi:hypothetical protein
LELHLYTELTVSVPVLGALKITFAKKGRFFFSRHPYNIMQQFEIQIYWVFGLFASFSILENTTFRKLDFFPSSSEGGGEDTQLGPIERANHTH